MVCILLNGWISVHAERPDRPVGDREREGPMPFTPGAFVRHLRAWFLPPPPQPDADLSLPVASWVPQSFAASAVLGRDRDSVLPGGDHAQALSALDAAVAESRVGR